MKVHNRRELEKMFSECRELYHRACRVAIDECWAVTPDGTETKLYTPTAQRIRSLCDSLDAATLTAGRLIKKDYNG